ncbi:amino acid transporter [Westerdykella ornata]|uniref:Amino acid transporter n=1 Tax=Westerdykella ornata TaxID=318751 RepID=A0A6A6JL43_WESOR|nr:amino acid transporter [Westerdykella ornata]KAF2276823.1 amino acid transporter [Westerdykella ornata]
MAESSGSQLYGTQSDAYAATHDLHHRAGSKERMPIGGEEVSVDDADELLAAMGYKPELVRTRSTLQVAFMSFVLASIPYGLSTTFYYPLVGGGPANIIWGFVGVSLIILCVAISLGEITSVFPTAGGVYYQTWMLANPAYRHIASWICGWSFVVGNITITLAVNFGTTLFLVGCLNVFGGEDGILEGNRWQVYLLFLAITLLCNAVSALGNKWLPWLDTFAIFWTFAGVIAIVICTLAIAKNGRNDASYVFGEFNPSLSGWPAGWSFCIGLLQAAYVTSSTGMIISMCEEVRHPSTQVPKAMVYTILLNLACGCLFLIPLLFVMPDQEFLANLASGQPLPPIIYNAVGHAGGTFALTIPLLVLGILCGIACTTAASRCTWAFARDGAIPGAQWWKTVNARLDVPLNAMMLSMAVQLLLGLIYFGSSAAFNAFSGVGVICLTLSYACPIAVSVLGGRKLIAEGSYNFGAFGLVANVIALAWSLLAIPLFCMPTAIPVTAELMNYASVVFAGFFVIATTWYFVWGKKHYQGPPTHEVAEFQAARRASITSEVVPK